MVGEQLAKQMAATGVMGYGEEVGDSEWEPLAPVACLLLHGSI